MIKQKATISAKKMKVAINTITWVWTKSLIIHTVTFWGIVNVENIHVYCDFFPVIFQCTKTLKTATKDMKECFVVHNDLFR